MGDSLGQGLSDLSLGDTGHVDLLPASTGLVVVVSIGRLAEKGAALGLVLVTRCFLDLFLYTVKLVILTLSFDVNNFMRLFQRNRYRIRIDQFALGKRFNWMKGLGSHAIEGALESLQILNSGRSHSGRERAQACLHRARRRSGALTLGTS